MRRMLSAFAFACATTAAPPGGDVPAASTLQLTSPDFAEGGAIPRVHTCEGNDLAPALAWTGAPAGTRAYALIVDDPDAPDPAKPRMTWVHWVLYDLPADATGLPRGGAP
ncbi:MAG TPA: YbhB/YbcL family Raf kinase inhibitor-like protein, partial [Myxococcota bacterium]|nr:YbhB/YbcL family Raf kinase inhibitor-like protein [Myxococcota bacterium]